MRANILRIVAALLWAILIGVVILLYRDCTAGHWTVGDVVCFRQTGRPGTVKWWHYGADVVGRPPSYVVVSVNDLNQVYEVTVPETVLQSCDANAQAKAPALHGPQDEETR